MFFRNKYVVELIEQMKKKSYDAFHWLKGKYLRKNLYDENSGLFLTRMRYHPPDVYRNRTGLVPEPTIPYEKTDLRKIQHRI